MAAVDACRAGQASVAWRWHNSQAPRLRMSGVTATSPYAFIACAGALFFWVSLRVNSCKCQPVNCFLFWWSYDCFSKMCIFDRLSWRGTCSCHCALSCFFLFTTLRNVTNERLKAVWIPVILRLRWVLATTVDAPIQSFYVTSWILKLYHHRYANHYVLVRGVNKSRNIKKG